MARTGRPRSFDKDEAVQQAMLLFWEQGFESTSLAQLKGAMGDISAASFYAAFDSKEALFRSALATYLETHGRVTAPLADLTLAPREAIERTLRGSAKMQTDPSHPLGCLIVLSAASCSQESSHVQAALAEERNRNRRNLHDCVQRAVEAGELAPNTDVAALASMFNTFLVGLSVQARDHVSLAHLDASISRLMHVWDEKATSRRRKNSSATPQLGKAHLERRGS
jgi:TetR/AcrR family transcriptional repressor for divergent bdcA